MPTKHDRVRLNIDVPRDGRRRVHSAAAQRDQSVQDYLWEAVEARLKRDLADDASGADVAVLNRRADPVLADLGTTQGMLRMTSFDRNAPIVLQ
jgi:hypothetical protein